MSPGPTFSLLPLLAHSTRRFSNQRHGCGGTLVVPLTPRIPPMLISRGSRSLLLQQQRGSNAARSPLAAASLMMTRWSLNLANSCRAPLPPSSSRFYSLSPLLLLLLLLSLFLSAHSFTGSSWRDDLKGRPLKETLVATKKYRGKFVAVTHRR